MNVRFVSALSLVAAASIAVGAQANSVNFSFSGTGISGSGVITYTPQSSGAGTITGISGVFTDTNAGQNGKPSIVNAPITGLVAISPVNPLPVNVTAPDFSQYAVANGVPGTPPSTSLSYDNNYYPDGSPVVCTDYPFKGGFLDVYGVLFTIPNGKVVGLWSNGVKPSGLSYGLAVADGQNTYDYVNDLSASVSAVPLPTAAWMGLTTLAGLAGISVLRKRRAKAA